MIWGGRDHLSLRGGGGGGDSVIREAVKCHMPIQTWWTAILHSKSNFAVYQALGISWYAN